MKRILGLDLGTNSIGWALVNEAETDEEVSLQMRKELLKEVCAVICSDINYVVMRWLNF